MIKTANNEMIVLKTKLGLVDWLMISIVSCVNLICVAIASYEMFNF
jgi:hypothetical protein